MMRYLLVSSDTDFELRLRAALGTSNGDLRRVGDEFLEQGSRGLGAVLHGDRQELTVLTIGPGVELGSALRVARLVDEVRPDVNVVLVLPEAGTDVLERALRAGVREVLSPDVPDDELAAALARAVDAATRRRLAFTGGASHRGQRRVIAVVSPKGGSGKTMVATNLAVALTQHAPGQVVLSDLDLAFGDAASSLGVVPEHDVSEAAGAVDRLDAMGLKVFLTSHSSGLNVLCAPPNPEAGDRVTSEQSGELVQLLSSEFPYVVLDTAAGINDHTLTCLEVCTDLVLVCSKDVASVRAMRKLLEALHQLGLTLPRQHLVLNRSDSRVGLEQEDVERTVGMQVTAAIPSDRSVPLSMNQGEPVVLSRGRSGVARGFADLADHLRMQKHASKNDRRSLLRR